MCLWLMPFAVALYCGCLWYTGLAWATGLNIHVRVCRLCGAAACGILAIVVIICMYQLIGQLVLYQAITPRLADSARIALLGGFSFLLVGTVLTNKEIAKELGACLILLGLLALIYCVGVTLNP